MKLLPRIIPSLLLKNGGLVKGKNFKDHVYVGDPINAFRIFNDKEVDEICLLNISNDEIGFVGLVGIFFLILYSYLTHFFIRHGHLHNILFLSIGII